MDGLQIREQVKELTAVKVANKLQDYKNDAAEDAKAFDSALGTFVDALDSVPYAGDCSLAWRILLSLIIDYPYSMRRVCEALVADTRPELEALIPASTISTTLAILLDPNATDTFNSWFCTALKAKKRVEKDQTEFTVLLICASVHVLLLKLEEMALERIDIVHGLKQAVAGWKYGSKGQEMYTLD